MDEKWQYLSIVGDLGHRITPVALIEPGRR